MIALCGFVLRSCEALVAGGAVSAWSKLMMTQQKRYANLRTALEIYE